MEEQASVATLKTTSQCQFVPICVKNVDIKHGMNFRQSLR